MVSLGRDLELLEILGRRHVWKWSSKSLVEVNLLDHELRCLLFVLELENNGALLRENVEVLGMNRCIVFGILCFGISTIEQTLDFALVNFSIVTMVDQIKGHPASVNDDSAYSIFLVDVCVEGGDELETLLAVDHLANLDLLVKVKVALNLYGLHAPLLLKLMQIFSSPGELASILWSDIEWTCDEGFIAPLCFLELVESAAVLEVSCLIGKDERWKGE